MPNFDQLHFHAVRLAELTKLEAQEIGIVSWGMFVTDHWKEIARMWNGDLVPAIIHHLTLTELAKEVHEANKKWWVCLNCTENGDYRSQCSLETEHCPPHAHNSYIKCPFCNGTKIAKRNVGEMIALMHSELSEALEGDRKGLKDDKLPQYEMVDVEMVDCIIRIFDFLGQKGIDVEQIFRDKMEF